MSKYQVVVTLKVRTASGIRELEPGETVALPDHLAEPLLTQGRIKPIVPYFDEYGDIRIPFGCDSRYHYWAGGQSIAETEIELKRLLH